MGRFSNGRSTDPEFDGRALAALGSVVVVINCRCGAFGFFSTRELEERTGQAVNAGLLDQVQALCWVQDNIASFGGDPDRVTIFGQLAGGISCRMHRISPASKGLFSRVQIQSGGGLNEAEFQALCEESLKRAGWTLKDLYDREAEEVYSVLDRVSCDLLERQELALFQPFEDGVTLTDVPGVLLARGEGAAVPTICGTVAGDSWMFSRKVEGTLHELGSIAYYRGLSFAASQSLAHAADALGRPIRTYCMDRPPAAEKGEFLPPWRTALWREDPAWL